MGLLRYLLKRLVSILGTISAVLALSYVLMHYAPGSFFSSANLASAMGTLKMENAHLYASYLRMFRDRYGLNLPLWRQVLDYVWHSLSFNFGNSFQNPSVPIMVQLRTAFPISAGLAFGSIVLALIIGFPLGVVAALHRNTWLDSVLTTLSMAGQAIPSFVLAVILVFVFGVWIPGVVPVNGWGTPANAVLPIVCLATGNVGVVTRYMRGSLIEALRQDYIRTAEAKGVPYRAVVWRHAMRNSLTALVTVIGPSFAFTVVGTVWVENIFSIPGLGTLLSGAFVNDDIPLAITSVFLLCLMVMGMNLLVDLSYALMNPRIRLE